MKIIVLGAGVIGVTSAWYLSRAGHEVTVIDRQPGPALETSFANGGQVSASHAVPWANPMAPRQILRFLARPDAPLLFHPRADWRQWQWGTRFLLECLPGRTRRNAESILALARSSLEELATLRRETGIEYEQRTQGILSLYFDGRDFERAVREAQWISSQGAPREPKTADQCLAIEPALASSRSGLAGGVFAPRDESGDAALFTERLAQLCEGRGVRFLYEHRIRRVEAGGRGVQRVVADGVNGERLIAGDAYVVALGSYSAPLLRPLGLALPVFPVKGYSVTLPLDGDCIAPHVSLTDEEHKLVFSRLGDRLRVAGMAEVAGYDTHLDEGRAGLVLKRALELFPGAGDSGRAQFWCGLRPATPGNVPLVCGTRYPNLFLNTGHGTLGWTLACGSGQRVADLVSGRAVDRKRIAA